MQVVLQSGTWGLALHVSLCVAVFRNKHPDGFVWVNKNMLPRL